MGWRMDLCGLGKDFGGGDAWIVNSGAFVMRGRGAGWWFGRLSWYGAVAVGGRWSIVTGFSLVALVLSVLYGAFWRLYLSPVAKFPGPRLAAVTFWYELYHDVVRGGQYVYEIERMHQKYGR
jgi:hypothetical protein